MTKPRNVIGITGGISTGKSTFAECLRKRLGARFFDADHAARQLVDHDPEVRELLVASSEEIQLQRLIARARLTPNDALVMIASQMPLLEKISRADHVIWNNGPLSVLEAQSEILAGFLALGR